MAHAKRGCQANPFAPRPAPHKWGAFNAARDELRRERAEHFHARPREPQGFASLRTHNKVRFGRLPARWRPVAEAELTRLLNDYIQRTGQHPTRFKVSSLVANAAAIVRNHRMRQQGERGSNWKAAQARWFRTRWLLNHLDAPPPPKPLLPRQRSKWSLHGV
jgi:hypothetical protein